MNFNGQRKHSLFHGVGRLAVALALVPFLSGFAFHYFSPCSTDALFHHACDSHSRDHFHTHCDTERAHHDCGGETRNEGEGDANDSDSLPTPGDCCPICEFLAMPRDATCFVAWDCVFTCVERHEPEPVRLFVVLYRSFEPGRAPPTVS